jgi:hypothetical protein
MLRGKLTFCVRVILVCGCVNGDRSGGGVEKEGGEGGHAQGVLRG